MATTINSRLRRIMAHFLVLVMAICAVCAMNVSASAADVTIKGKTKAVYSGTSSVTFAVKTGSKDSKITFSAKKGKRENQLAVFLGKKESFVPCYDIEIFDAEWNSITTINNYNSSYNSTFRYEKVKSQKFNSYTLKKNSYYFVTVKLNIEKTEALEFGVLKEAINIVENPSITITLKNNKAQIIEW